MSEEKHPSHDTVFSFDASSYDERCKNCGATDIAGGGWGRLAKPCPSDHTGAYSMSAEDTDPERLGERCRRCGRHNPSWSAPSPLWNAVMRGGAIVGDPLYDDLVCATCFMILAEEAGIAQSWHLTAETVNARLETETPSGRIWDDKRLLWVEPGEEQNVQVTQALEPDDGPVADTARMIASYADGPSRRNVYLAAKREIAAFARHRTRAEPDLVEVPPLIERLEFASANRVCAAPGANGRLCGKCYKCLMRQAAKALRVALTRAKDSDKTT